MHGAGAAAGGVAWSAYYGRRTTLPNGLRNQNLQLYMQLIDAHTHLFLVCTLVSAAGDN